MKTAIYNSRIFDGNSTVLENASILFDETGILEIAKGQLTGDISIDGTGKTVTPGLIDCHVHLGGSMQEADPVAVAAICAVQVQELWKYGITTVRTCGTQENIDIKIRTMVNEGKIPGVRILASGRGICITGGHGWFFGIECDTVDEVRKAAREQIKQTADVIKLFATGGMGTRNSVPNATQLSEAQMRVAVEEAEKVGILTCAHCTGLEGAKNAIRAGVRSIEHAQLDRDTAELMRAHGTFYCPTIVTRYNILNTTLPEYQWMRQKADPADLDRKKKALMLCKELGITICCGTDAGPSALTPLGVSTSTELEIYAAYGLTPIEALRTAMYNASVMLKIDHLTGMLKAGKCADIAVWDGNPLADMKALKSIHMTFQNGRLCFKK
jgi:imidazolonepropionase-like amidohydrolase